MKSLVVIVAALLMLWGLHSLVQPDEGRQGHPRVAEDQAAGQPHGHQLNRMISLTFLIAAPWGAGRACSFGMQYA